MPEWLALITVRLILWWCLSWLWLAQVFLGIAWCLNAIHPLPGPWKWLGFRLTWRSWDWAMRAHYWCRSFKDEWDWLFDS